MKVILNRINKGNIVTTYNSNIGTTNNLNNNQDSDFIDYKVTIGDRVVVPLKYGHKLGYYLGQSVNGLHQYLEFNYRSMCLGKSVYKPIPAKYKISSSELELSLDTQVQDYLLAVEAGDKSFTFNIEELYDH